MKMAPLKIQDFLSRKINIRGFSYSLNAPAHRELPETSPFTFSGNRSRAARRWRAWCTPGMGVSVGVQIPCRRFTFMHCKIHEANYESKARASPRGGV